MTTWSKSVLSSHVAEVGYNAESAELEVYWKTGRVSAYSGVPEDVAMQVANSASVGQALNTMIKPIYAHRYI